VTGEDAMCLKF